jgi:putative PEP-CTERM system TPR-repeat lipoprotein
MLRVLLVLVLLAGCSRMHSNEQLMAEARQYVAQGDTRAAVIQLKNVLQQAPANGAARMLLGQLYLGAGDVLSADKELRRAQELGVNPGTVLPLLGKAMLMQGQYDKLLEQIKADDQQPQLMALRGHALIGLERIDEARVLFDNILLRHPGHAAALLGQARLALQDHHTEAALRLIDQALASNPAEVDGWRLKGDLLRMQNKTGEALAAYQHMLKLSPELIQPHIDIASLYIQTGKLAEARAELGLARKVASNSLMVSYTQALLEFREGRLAPAQEQLALVLRAAPDHPPANLLMGTVLRGLGNMPQAELHLRKFLGMNPGHPYASKQLASVLMSNGSPDQALALVEPLFDQHQQDLEMMSLAGEIYMRLRQYARAAAYFEKASALAPKTSMLRAALAMSHIGMGDNARAIAELEEATSMDAKSTRAGVLLALTQLRAKEFDKALAAVRKMESQEPDNPMVQNLKGGILLMRRDNAGARASFERALKLAPTYLPALDNLTQMDMTDKKPEQARLRLEAALDKDKKNVDIMTALGNLAISQGQVAVAGGWLERAARENPDAVEPSMVLAQFYVRNKEVPKAVVLMQKVLATNPATPEVLSFMAELQLRNRNNDAALESLGKLAVVQPGSADVQVRIAAVRQALGDADGALQALNKALSLQPDHAQAQAALVRMLIDQQAYPKAMAAARTFQKTRSDAPLGYKLEADVQMAQKHVQPALALYQKAYDMQPSSAWLIPLHGAMLQAGQSKEAGARMQRWLAEHPADLVARLYFSSSLMAERDYAASRTQLEQILKQAPRHVIALNNLAWIYQQQHDPRALDLAEQAYKLAPADAAVLDTLGWMLVEQGKVERALPLLRQAVAQRPQNTELRYHLGVALNKKGDKRAAREQLEQLLALKDFDRRDAVKALLAQ